MALVSDPTAVLKRKRTTVRGIVTKFITLVNSINHNILPEEIEHYTNRLQKSLLELKQLDDEIHSLLSDADYALDTEKCEEYIDNCERAISKGKRFLQDRKKCILQLSEKTTSKVRMLPSMHLYLRIFILWQLIPHTNIHM